MPYVDPVSPRRPLRPIRPAQAAAVLVALALAVGILQLPGELSEQATYAASGSRLARIGDLPVLPGAGPQRTRFLVLVRRTVPVTESVRIVQAPAAARNPLESRRTGVRGVCGYESAGGYFWAVYAIYPRPSTCDPNARWTMYYGVVPPPLPETAAVYRTAPDLVLVRR
jgi:hypothetical protein